MILKLFILLLTLNVTVCYTAFTQTKYGVEVSTFDKMVYEITRGRACDTLLHHATASLNASRAALHMADSLHRLDSARNLAQTATIRQQGGQIVALQALNTNNAQVHGQQVKRLKWLVLFLGIIAVLGTVY